MTDVAIAGVGYTSFTRKSGRSVLESRCRGVPQRRD